MRDLSETAGTPPDNQKIYTLVYPVRDGNVLLGRKKRTIGVGMFNGWGGKVEEHDTSVRTAAARELFDEAGLIVDPEKLDYHGTTIFHNEGTAIAKATVHLFITTSWSGELKVKEDEMTEPTWWPIDALPFDEMTASDSDWLPQVLAGHKIEALVWNGPDQRTLLQPTIVNILE